MVDSQVLLSAIQPQKPPFGEEAGGKEEDQGRRKKEKQRKKAGSLPSLPSFPFFLYTFCNKRESTNCFFRGRGRARGSKRSVRSEQREGWRRRRRRWWSYNFGKTFFLPPPVGFFVLFSLERGCSSLHSSRLLSLFLESQKKILPFLIPPPT